MSNVTTTEILKEEFKNYIVKNEVMPETIIISYKVYKALKSDFEKDKPKEICKTECKDITFMGLYIHIDDSIKFEYAKFIN